MKYTKEKPKDLNKWLGLFCRTKDGKTQGKITSIEGGIVNIRIFGKGKIGIAHCPIKDILWLGEKQREGRCNFEVGFNGLGMIIFSCKTHGKPDVKEKPNYKRLKLICQRNLYKKIREGLKI